MIGRTEYLHFPIKFWEPDEIRQWISHRAYESTGEIIPNGGFYSIRVNPPEQSNQTPVGRLS